MKLYELSQMQGLPLQVKILKTQLRIREWYEYWNGEVYISFSGGKDSTVLLDIARKLYPDIETVFLDTGLEYPEIRDFVGSKPNITWLTPEKSFRKVILQYGYPIISKEIANAVYYARLGSKWAIDKMNGLKDGKYNKYRQGYIKYKYLINAPFAISNICCNELKKRPAQQYEKLTGKKCIVGTMACESSLRNTNYLKTGCNSFDSKRPMCRPLSFWKEEDIWEYIRKYNVEYSSIYNIGYKRTGCMFCMFGVHLEKEPNRFQFMKQSHPKLWEYCMKPVYKGGLGLKNVLDYIGVKSNQQYRQLNFL